MINRKWEEEQVVGVDETGGGGVMGEFVSSGGMVNQGGLLGNVGERKTVPFVLGGGSRGEMWVRRGNCDVDGDIMKTVVGEWGL